MLGSLGRNKRKIRFNFNVCPNKKGRGEEGAKIHPRLVLGGEGVIIPVLLLVGFGGEMGGEERGGGEECGVC